MNTSPSPFHETATTTTTNNKNINFTLPVPLVKLEDLFIAVKTTSMHHEDRLGVILETWFETAMEQTWFFTDYMDWDLNKRLGKEHTSEPNRPFHNLRASNSFEGQF